MGYRVSGLAEEGLAKSKLTVPLLWKDYHLFSVCPALTRPVLEHTGIVFNVTPHTFDGADQVRVYVFADTYHLYRDGQGCETNS